MGPVIDSNEAMRCEYISTILHTAVSLLEDLMITPQANIIGEVNTGRVDYAIKKIISEILEEIICITEEKAFQATLDEHKNEQEKAKVENTLKDSTELRKNVKRILEVIVGLLMDRASASSEPATKKRRVEEITNVS
ncbi:hypothetical protein C1646_767387 [Rhizophagus diaphanus]|nr:hypothetical protein C1646_767387 [Rhizophagus diaphanus] [Rhizophagus sp. MUCL 43196]